MKTKSLPLASALALCGSLLLNPLPASAVVFTNNTLIGVFDTTYDGGDIVVSNSVLTVDGSHSFTDLRIATGAVLTHTATATGLLTYTRDVTNEVQILSGTNAVALSNANVTAWSVVVQDSANTITYAETNDYVLSVSNSFTTLQRSDLSSIPDGATVLVSYSYTTSSNAGLNLTIAGNFEVEPGASINTDGCGYSGNSGPGRGGQSSGPLLVSGAGAGYGGNGGISSSNAFGGVGYDSPVAPAMLGSPGGRSSTGFGGDGGGRIQVDVAGMLINNGLITANGMNGTNNRSGGGSGGCVSLTAQTFGGNGTITADGGNGEPIHGGGGGGGRIAVVAETNAFTGTLRAIGGTGWQAGGAGTIYTKFGSSNGFVLFDNGSRIGALTYLQGLSGQDVTISGAALVSVSSSASVSNLLVTSSSRIATGPLQGTTLAVLGNAMIEAGASILSDGMGFSEGTGNGRGGTYISGSVSYGGGAGHGGYGANATNSPNPTLGVGGTTYGSISAPTTLGSSGGGSSSSLYQQAAGGGALRLVVNGNLTVNGKISANGESAWLTGYGGGSGGSIWMTVGTLSGSGAISADGGNGNGPTGGGGGGGRIAVEFNTNLFTGAITAYGGSGPGTNWAGAGTVHLKQNGQLSGLLILDNGGHLGTNTPSTGASTYDDLVIQGKAAGVFSGSLTFRNVNVASNGVFRVLSYSTTSSSLSVTDMSVQSGGALLLDGIAGSPNTGTGGTSGSTGGAHAGTGGLGTNGLSGGNNTYDSISSPNAEGSSGAPSSMISGSQGGRGGGAIHITASHALVLDGKISANGTDGIAGLGGGASGGSIWLTVGTLSGAGTISANGGNGLNGGGGGGGGRISINYATNLFLGNISANGGTGYRPGGAGTIYTKANQALGGTILINNSTGFAGNTPVSSTSSFDELTVNSGVGVLTPAVGAPTTFKNLLVASNATLLITNGTSSIIVNGNVTIQAGGMIHSDASGYGGGSGINGGAGTSLGTGGGHGGYGAGGTNGTAGGGAYDSATSPTSYGSGGNPSSNSQYGGGTGGGVVPLAIAGLLRVDGRISANGTTGFNLTSQSIALGGGAGGSIHITAGGLAGAGVIMANGGSGLNGGGGGGGGRIALVTTSNSFSGVISAYGGSGFRYGGAGTVYIGTNQIQLPGGNSGTIVIDNGGFSGTNTPISTTTQDIAIRGKGVGMITTSGTSIRNLLIDSNGLLSFPNSSVVALTVTGNATIQNGGSLLADGAGSSPGSGQGSGSNYGTGGGHGGYGGSGTNGFSGGNSYDSITGPTMTGSGGNPYPTGYTVGGSGGGIIRMTVNGLLTVNGKISASGTDGVYIYNLLGGPSAAGGGSGGSIWLTLGGLAGTGTISANGGSGLNGGGGGGGGRIAITYNSNLLSGIITARGGTGYRSGGAGTIYTRINNSNAGQVLIDNGGLQGTNTPISSFTEDVAIANGGIVSLTSPIRNLLISSNGWLVPSAQVNINGNATVLAGGGIIADGTGTSTSGLGSTTGTPKGGAGHGGFGGANSGGFGNVYGSIIAPSLTGSRGGDGGTSYGVPPLGGFGGGAIRLNVAGNLSIDGRVSADGLAGAAPNTGGGSGGSVWLTVGGLSGSGIVSAKGGSGTGYAGGGGGGRIAITYTSNNFAGVISSAGGTGTVAGGAGTIYTKKNNQLVGQLLISNGGLSGTNTPLSSSYGLPTAPFDLLIADGASVYPATPLPLLSNLTVSAGGLLTSLASQSNLTIAVLSNLNIESNGLISVNGKGFTQSTGSGVGQNIAGPYGMEGAGAGYGGIGGASAAGATGGTNYGSASQPTDRGSGGGLGAGPTYSGGSSGGGAIRLSVGGGLNINGQLSADGNAGYQDNAGGGSGGSIWITANQISGGGRISADGGDGELFRGGGGGAGRIAIYAPANTFTGIVTAAGGFGASNGQDAKIWMANTQNTFQITSHSPTGTLNTPVSYVDLTFNEIIAPGSVTTSNMTLFTPSGLISSENLSASPLGLSGVRVSFPNQNLNGDYRLEVGSGIQDLFGQVISQVYTGAFTLALPTINGTVTNTEGQPVAGIVINPNGGFSGALTDGNGNYTVFVPYGWSGNIYAQSATLMFLPSFRSFTNVTDSITNQNFVAVTTIAPPITASIVGTNLSLNWNGFSGVIYQLYSSTNLVDWEPYSNPLGGSDAVIEVQIPIDIDPTKFFRVQANN